MGTCLTILNSDVARFTSNIGFDFVFLDLEHTPMGPEAAKEIIRTIHAHSEGETHVIVRIPTFGHEWVAWMLDAGAAGIVVPHSETAEQARQIVEAAKFPPFGKRSYPPFTAVPGVTDGLPKGKRSLYQVYNEHAAIIMQIESKKGCENAHEILAVPGVDATMIGAGDLRMELGLPPVQDGPEPAYQSCVQQVFKAAKDNGDMPVFGFAFGPAFIESKVKQGYRGIMVTSDVTSLVYKQMADLKLAREMIQQKEDGLNNTGNDKAKEVVGKINALSLNDAVIESK